MQWRGVLAAVVGWALFPPLSDARTQGGALPGVGCDLPAHAMASAHAKTPSNDQVTYQARQ